MKIKNTRIYGFTAAIRGMRNSRQSWDLSDTAHPLCSGWPELGPEDLKLMLKLVQGGSEHRKFLRVIMITADLTLPRYVWQEWDTYKVATVRLSESSMDTLGKRPLRLSDFQDGEDQLSRLSPTLDQINDLAQDMKKYGKVNKEKAFACRRLIKQLLPESFLQLSTVQLSYETALSILRQRSNHRLSEWRLGSPGSVCDWLINLPYLREFYEATQ